MRFRFLLLCVFLVNLAGLSSVHAEDLRIEVDGATLHVEVDGPIGAPAILTFNGAGCTTNMWDKVVPRVADRFRFIRFDVRGTGRSTPSESEDGYTFEQYSEDAIAILKHFGYEKSIVWTMAWGSRAGVAYAGLHPERVQLLALYDASVGRADMTAQRARNAKAREARIAAGEPVFDYPEGWNTHLDDEAKAKGLGAARTFDNLPGQLKNITAPTLVCTGDFDPNLVESRKIVAGIKGARLEIMNNIGHGSVLQRPDLTTQIFLAFVDEHMDRLEADVEWRHPGGNVAHHKYSSLNQINRGNAGELEIVWQWEMPDKALISEAPKLERSQNNTQPIMVDGVLYATSASSQLVALDPTTGKPNWVFNPKSFERGPPTTARGFLHRGASYWTDGKEKRILYVSSVGELYSVDAKTGEPDADFGDAGLVDLKQFLLRKKVASTISGTSPPLIVGNVVIPSYWMSDQSNYKEMPPGDIWAFDVRTGKRLWTFHTIPRDGEFGAETWEGESRTYTGNANPWAPISADEQLGYIYVPVSMPTNLWYGGHRRGDNLFGNSILCLDAKTGKRVWHFQMIHHDIWDYDVSAAPVICDIVVDGKPIQAVAQVTKQSFTYVFDRVTGEPVWPIEEREVLRSVTPGEAASPTQPFPTKPAAFDLQGFWAKDVIDFTPLLHREAIQILDTRGIRFVPMYKPATKEGVIQSPGFGGGANWGGAAFDPETNLLYVPSATRPINIAMKQPDPNRATSEYVMGKTFSLDGPQGLPLMKPPYSRITAIDMNTGDHAWMTPLGSGPRHHPVLSELKLGALGSQSHSGILVTKELVFATGKGHVLIDDGDDKQPMLYAFDKATGECVAEHAIPSAGRPGAMTYSVDGRQYIVLGTGYLREDPYMVAFALPE